MKLQLFIYVSVLEGKLNIFILFYFLFTAANVSPRFLLRTENQFAVGLDAFLLQRRAKKLPKSINAIRTPISLSRPEMNSVGKDESLADYPSHSF